MTGLEYILTLNEVCHFRSTERKPGPCSNGELRRLLDQNALHINGKAVKSKDLVSFPIKSVILFPKSTKGRITLL